MQPYRQYDFPNALIRVYHDGRCREVPKWCLCISVERPRGHVAQALWQLRAYLRHARAATAAAPVRAP